MKVKTMTVAMKVKAIVKAKASAAKVAARKRSVAAIKRAKSKTVKAMVKAKASAAKVAAGKRSVAAIKRAKSKIARGQMAKFMVLKGSKAKTSGGLTKDKLSLNKKGKIVSRKASEASKARFHLGGRSWRQWHEAVAVARKQLNVSGFVLINGPTIEGKAIFKKARALYNVFKLEAN